MRQVFSVALAGSFLLVFSSAMVWTKPSNSHEQELNGKEIPGASDQGVGISGAATSLAQALIEANESLLEKKFSDAERKFSFAVRYMGKLAELILAEQDKVEALSRDLEAARAEVAALKPKQDPKAPLETQQEGAAHSAQISPSSVSSAVALEPETTGATGAQVSAQPEHTQHTPATQGLQNRGDEERLLGLAERLLRTGNITSARLVLERAMHNGSARAAFRLAETYDPNTLAKRKVVGIQGDARKARELYERASAGGVHEASGRLH